MWDAPQCSMCFPLLRRIFDKRNQNIHIPSWAQELNFAFSSKLTNALQMSIPNAECRALYPGNAVHHRRERTHISRAGCFLVTCAMLPTQADWWKNFTLASTPEGIVNCSCLPHAWTTGRRGQWCPSEASQEHILIKNPESITGSFT